MKRDRSLDIALLMFVGMSQGILYQDIRSVLIGAVCIFALLLILELEVNCEE